MNLAGLLQAKKDWERDRDKGKIRLDDPKAEAKARARQSLLDFTCYTLPSYEVNWHHQRFCYWIEKALRGECDRLMILVPPRHGKSEAVSRRLPAFALGQNPDTRIIACSYSADLGSRLNRDVQRIIDTPTYRELFPDTTLNSKNVSSDAKGSYLRNSEIFEIVGHQGGYRSAGVGGGITGMGFDLGILDDVFKNREEAESKTVRDGIWEWYTSTFRTRAEKGAKIILVMTPWHHDDIAGRLLKVARENPKADQWTVVKFPAIATDDLHPDDPRQPGEALWEGKYPLEELERIKASVGPYDWSSLFQCSPSREGGNLFNQDWFHYWVLLPRKFDRVIISLNSKFKEVSASSYVTLQVWGRSGGSYYLLDQVRDRLSFLDTKDAISDLTEKWAKLGITIHELFIEAKKNGKAILENLSSDCPITITATDFNGDTEGGKAQAVTGLFKLGKVFIPPESEALWVSGLKKELEDFPNAESEDQTGALTQALIYLALRQTNRPYEKFNRATHGLRGQDAIDFSYDPNLDLHISFDWNRSPACAVAAQVRGNEVFAIAEWYLDNSDTFRLTEAVGSWIKSLGHRNTIHVHGDATGRNQTANSTQSNWDIFWATMRRLELKSQCRKRYKDANPPEQERVISVNYLFMSDRAFVLVEKCDRLVQDFENVQWTPDGKIDKKRDARLSHISDAYGYLVHDLFPYRQQGRSRKQQTQKPVAGLS
ncbi:hypothetical protein NIES2135_21060 [Leptolyngbya boryana NIES-2135]|uniref:Uncharacterized protein n=1 Tax=Leptolyngbya boryana NIES-2135 TaxID=1973484 RepID=A0A1Z4JF49_LEPBY|nr:terminase family protein [Leptolyngbya boryana]MBD2369367.1 hypothetical protein [Leptolyngbya sp. FACHB-161]MBD2375631.1 hypothetical protein [Leptolyngbya sp. FACHB-238]MBD2401696.1 hypothetical protein [Leptolyngbya sp. FACHB-239]MBD2406565.1 hypothetical protein [Leptolyngbya sp. FACHB-402]BAY55283.1 hypothetical protein NIES2135_21060 [Leptolyngbya boryana NIES-2135]